jgi:hypothetical protein
MKIAEGGHWSLQSLCMYRITDPYFNYIRSLLTKYGIYLSVWKRIITAAFSQFMRRALGVAIGITSSLG